MTVQIYLAEELPSEVPGAVFTDGDVTVILFNPAYDRDWLRGVVNSLLDRADPAPALSAVG